MLKWIRDKWTDPVWSKVFSNLIWALIIFISTFLYIYFRKLIQQISFNESYTKIIEFLNSSSLISNKVILAIFFVLFFAVINKISIFSLVRETIPRLFMGPYGKREYSFNFNNANSEENGVIKQVLPTMSKNHLRLKPTSDSLQWKFRIYISHTYKYKEKGELHPDINMNLTIYKDVNKNILFLKDSKKNQISMLLKEYYFQGLDIDFLNYNGGITIKIFRENNLLYESEHYFGYNLIFYTATGSGQDFELQTVHTIIT